MEGGALTAFPFYRPDDEKSIVFVPGANRKDGCISIKCCTLAKLIEKMTQIISYDTYSVSAFLLTYRDYTTPLEVVQLLATRYSGPPHDSSKDHLRLFEIEVEIVQTNVVNMFRQIIGTLNEKDFDDKVFTNIAIEFINSMPEDTKNELFLIFFSTRKQVKASSQTPPPPRPQTTNITSASSTMRFSFAVSPKTQSPHSTSNVLHGLLSNNGSPNSTQTLQPPVIESARSSIKLPKGLMSKILTSSSSNSSSNNSSSNSIGGGSSSSIANSSSASSSNLHSTSGSYIGLNGGQMIDEDNPYPEKTSFPPELIARELTVMEFELISALTLNEFSQKQWNKENQAINIQNLITWFNRISSWVSTKIISKETPEERAVIIEAFITIANYAKELKNYNCVMEILGSLHNSSISRLKNSWALISQKANDMFQTLNQAMSPDNNFKMYRKHLSLVLTTEPCIPYLGLFLTDYTYLAESNPPLINDGMVNVERVYLISARIQEFFQLFTNCNYGFVSTPQVREAILAEKVWDENEIFRLSKIREEHSSTSSPTNGSGSEVKSGSSSGSSLSISTAGGEKRRKNFVTKYRMSFTGNDPPPSIAPSLSERDWKILTTNAKTVKYKKGKRILTLGDINHNLYRVQSGRVKFEHPTSPEETRYIEAGEIFGEESFLYDRPLSANVISDSDECELIEIEKTFILQLFSSEPILAATYYKHIAVLMAERVLFVLNHESTDNNNNNNNNLSSSSNNNNNGSNHSSNNSSPNYSPSSSLVSSQSATNLSSMSDSNSNSNTSTSTTPTNSSPKLNSSQSTLSLVDKRRSVALEPSSIDLQRIGNDSRFISTFRLSPEEVIVKSYTCKHNGITGTLYITKHHICFEGKFFGMHKQKMSSFEKVSKILPEKGALSLTANDKVKKFSFKNQEELSEAYGIMTKIWKNHFNIVRSPVKSVSASTTPPTPPRSPKVGRGESFSSVTDLPTKDEWSAILKGAKTVTFKRGEVLVTEGAEFQKIFQITKGECTIVRGLASLNNNNNDNNNNNNNINTTTSTSTTYSPSRLSPSTSLNGASKGLVVLTKLGAGSIFGELSFLVPGGSPISVIVSSDVLEVYTLEGYFLNIVLKSKSLLSPKFYKYLACVLDTRMKQFRQSII